MEDDDLDKEAEGRMEMGGQVPRRVAAAAAAAKSLQSCHILEAGSSRSIQCLVKTLFLIADGCIHMKQRERQLGFFLFS